MKRYRAIYLILAIMCMRPLIKSQDSAEKIFTHIYETGVWGKPWFSGGGSTVVECVPYMQLLQNILKKYHIKSVADIGCGDWLFSRHIDWAGINYNGYDVVKHLIETNQKEFGTDNINFKHADFTTQDIPQADLLLCKEVLQHVTNEDVHYFITHCLPKFKYCLIVNEVDYNGSSDNPDQIRGETRKIDLTRAPFFVKGEVLLIYQSAPGIYKQVLWIENNV